MFAQLRRNNSRHLVILTGSHFSRQKRTIALNCTCWLLGNLKALKRAMRVRLSVGSLVKAGKTVVTLQPCSSRRSRDESPFGVLATMWPAIMSKDPVVEGFIFNGLWGL